jgi:DNA repair protein RAD50
MIPEYKEIDEHHRVMVKEHETTQVAVSDIDKDHSALDYSLLLNHQIKIAEINRIIPELWNLAYTYKGEDIELASSQERSPKNRTIVR